MTFLATVSAMREEGRLFREGRPIYVCRAPGRLDLMGGNADYTGGWVFESTIREATWAAVQLCDDDSIVLVNPQMSAHGWEDCARFSLGALDSESAVRDLVSGNPAIRWTAYVLGIFYLLRRRDAGRVTQGAKVYIVSDVPMNTGVSSSAAVEVPVAKAVASAYGMELAGIDLAESCQWIENVIAQSPCGIMDQATIVLGDEGYLLPLLCQPCCPSPPVRLPAGLSCWAIDSGVKHEVSGRQCEAARAAAFMGYKLICDWEGLPVERDESGRIPRWRDPRWNGYLSNLPPSLFRSRYEGRLPEQLSGRDYLASGQVHVDPFTPVRDGTNYAVKAASRYAVEENHRIRMFIELARCAANSARPESAFELMGDLMFQSHYSYTECGLGCEATDYLVELVRSETDSGLYGAKITGGGAGGTVAVLGRRDAEDAFRRVVSRYAGYAGATPYVFEGSSEGADRYGVQIV
jgi:L-arabinokinase